MDVVDRAQQEIDFSVEHRPAKDTRPEAEETGFCLYCGEPVPNGHRWCSKECHEDWEREQKIKARQRGTY